jgi:hypothetical protein
MAVAYRKQQPSMSRYLAPGLVAVGGGFVVLFCFLLIRANSAAPAAAPPPAGWVAVLVSPAPIPAYTKLTRDHLWNPKKGEFSHIFMDPAEVTSNMATRFDMVIGRVLKTAKAAGYVFTEEDFTPKHTRPGLPAGIPSGWRAMRLAADKVEGLIGLEEGDSFDLISTIAIEPKALEGTNVAGSYPPQLRLDQAKLKHQAVVRVIVHGGIIVQPLQTRQVLTSNSSLFNGQSTRGKPVQEIVIAAEPDEMVQLAEALAVEAKLTCLPCSGRSDDDKGSVTKNHDPVSPFNPEGTGPLAIIDVRGGQEHTYRAVPRATGEKKE